MITNIHFATIRNLARKIEAIRPGTCTGLVEELEELRGNPEYKKYQLALYKDKFQELWDSIKDSLSPSEKSDILAEVDFDISDPSKWDELWGDKMIAISGSTDNSSILSAIVGFIKDIYEDVVDHIQEYL